MSKAFEKSKEFLNKYKIIPGVLIALTLIANAYFPTYSFAVAALACIVMFFFLGNDLFSQKTLFLFLIPFFGVICIGFLSAFTSNDGLSNSSYFRDIFYLVQNGMFFCGGYLLCTQFFKQFKKMSIYIIVAAIIIVLYNMFSLLRGGKIEFEFARVVMLKGMETVLVAAFLSFFEMLKKQRNIWISVFYILVFVLCFAGFVLSFSRTGMILLIVFIVLFAIYSKTDLELYLSVGLLALLVVVFIVSFFVEIPLISYYSKKIAASFNEISIFHDWSNGGNRTRYWRGYEAFCALEDFKAGYAHTYLFGKGYGHNIRLGYAQPIGNSVYIDLPILHNAYLASLVKYGVVGTLLLIGSFVLPVISMFKKKDGREVVVIGFSLLVYLLLSPLFVTSILSSCSSGCVLFLYAMMVAFASSLEKGETVKRRKAAAK